MRRFNKIYYKLHKGYLLLAALKLVFAIYLATVIAHPYGIALIVLTIGLPLLHYLYCLYDYISDDDNLFI